jgi:polar amino acid transport system substrate-binding protein
MPNADLCILLFNTPLLRLFVLFCTLLTSLLYSSSTASSAVQPRNPVMISAHPDYPPLMYEQEGELHGMTIDIATELFESLNIPYQFIFSGPWNRVQQRAKSGHIDMIAGIYKNSTREQYLLYSIPIFTGPDAVFVKAGKTFPFETLSDLIDKKGTSNLGESFGTTMDQFIENHLTIQRVVNSAMNYKLLDLERVDYFLFGLYPGQAQAKRLGYDNRIVSLKTPFATGAFYFTFSKKSRHKHLISKVNRYIKEHINDDYIEQLHTINLNKYLATP